MPGAYPYDATAGTGVPLAGVREERMCRATLIERSMPTERPRAPWLLVGVLVVAGLPAAPAQAGSAAFERFLGRYAGQSDTIPAGEKARRALRVAITPYKNGFTIDWHTKMQKTDGRLKQRGLTVNFIPTPRPNIYASAMRTDLFGHAVPMDPMKGDPFVWVTITGNTLALYLIRITDNGEQDLQIDQQTLTPEGLHLEFTRFYGSEPVRRFTATLKKVGGGGGY